MEDTIRLMKSFLKDFTQQVHSPTTEENVIRNVGNYLVYPEDVAGLVIDWVVNYLENKKCPHALAVAVAQKTLQQISDSFSKEAEINERETPCAVTLYCEIMNKLPEVCASFLDQQINLEEVFSTCSSPFNTSVFAIKNKRRRMEDKHVIYPDLNAVLNLKNVPLHSYYAVFDGHAGIDAANFASAQLHVNISKHPAFLTDTVTAIKDAYKITDEAFLNRCKKENIRSGCTVLCALIRQNTVYLSWLGDSQAILVKQGKSVMITNPHKPDREDERERIESLGGHIVHLGIPRVNGILAVTRALGDPDHKPLISSEPDLSVLNLDGTEDFLILACDGLWDGMSPEEVTSSLYRNLLDSSPDETLDTIAAKLVHQSKFQGSEDNITAVVIFLRDLSKIREDAEKSMPNVTQVNIFQQEFFSFNGKSADSNDSFAKPNVLELSTASTKKLKNTANVLSSAGFENAAYYQFTENVESTAFQNVNTDFTASGGACGISIPIRNPHCFAPEATALSELPTPPIDDILASQKFEKFSAAMCQEISTDSGYQSSFNSAGAMDYSNVLAEKSNLANESSQLTDLHSCDEASDIKEFEGIIYPGGNESITPDEAVGIATSVVSSTIETAVKCLSSPEGQPLPSPTQSQLNPYAEPFVMKSYFAAEDIVPSSVVADKSKASVMENSEQLIDSEIKKDSSENNTLVNAVIAEHKIAAEPQSALNLSEKDHELLEVESTNSSLSTDLLNQNLILSENVLNPFESPEPVINLDSLVLTPESLKYESNSDVKYQIENEFNIEPIQVKEMNVKNKLENELQGLELEVSHVEKNVDKYTPYSQEDSSSDSQLIVEKMGNLNTTAGEKAAEIVRDHIKCITNESIELMNQQDVIKTEAILPSVPVVEEALVAADTQSLPVENIIKDTSPEIGAQIKLQTELNTKTSEFEELLEKNQFDNELNIKPLEFEGSSFKENVDSVAPKIHDSRLDSSPTVTVEKLDILDMLENGGKLEKTDANHLLKTIAKESIELVNTQGDLKQSEALLPAVPVEEVPVEPVAVDLQSLPAGIPEAEGVTEDIDSDSEKDGGWSYMKASNADSLKTKVSEKDTHAKDPVGKTESLSKKGAAKPAIESKIKTKTTTLVDKNKKALAEKKLDVKEKSKVVKSATLVSKTNVEKVSSRAAAATTATTTFSRVKKEAIAKVSTTTTSKVSRVTVTKNIQVASAKTIPSNTEKVVAAKAVGSSTLKSKISSTQESKLSTRPSASSTLPKGQPLHQSNKSNVNTVRNVSNRPLTSVPSKVTAAAKPPTRPVTADSKVKPLSNTRSTVSSTLKRPDVKEVKDTVNKQISAGKSVTLTSNKVEASAKTTLSNRRSVPANSRSTVSKTFSGLSAKNEVSKKEVPKIPTSKPSTKGGFSSKLSKVQGKEKNSVSKSTVIVDSKKGSEAMVNETKVDAVEVTPSSGEEKFLLEANCKETMKEPQEKMSEASTLCLENGNMEDMKLTEAISEGI